MDNKDKIEKVIETLLNKMFEIAGHGVTYTEVKGNSEDWWDKYTMTTQQNEEWLNFGVEYIRKKLRWSKKRAIHEMEWLNLNIGLRIKENDQ